MSLPNKNVVNQLTATYSLFLQLTTRVRYADRQMSQLLKPVSVTCLKRAP
jgi:hypothetical protein